MADWNTPSITSTYLDLINILKQRDEDLAKGLTSGINLPLGAIRWSDIAKRWEKLGASGWSPLATSYDIDVNKLGGQGPSYYLDWNNLTGVPSTFPPASHTHDDRYFTETEANSKFATSLVVNGNNVELKSASGGVLSTITVAYATTAGNATTVAGKSVNQNLRTSDVVSFAEVSTGSVKVSGSGITFGTTTLVWDNATSQLKLGTGRVFSTFDKPQWGDVQGKPTTFTPSAHSHDFGGL